MKFIAIAGLTLAGAAGGLYATDALTRGEVYALPYEQAVAELSAMPLPAEVTQFAPASAGAQVDVRQDRSVIAWRFVTGGTEVGRFSATLSAEGPERTRVIVDYVATGEPPEGYLRISNTTMMRKLAAAALAEQIDSRLERRPFERDGFMLRAAEHLQSHPEQIEEYGVALGETMKDLAEQARVNAEASTVTHEQTRYGTPSPDATRPTMDLSRN